MYYFKLYFLVYCYTTVVNMVIFIKSYTFKNIQIQVPYLVIQTFFFFFKLLLRNQFKDLLNFHRIFSLIQNELPNSNILFTYMVF